MYPLGALFGLGFDTATEIGLLCISAAEAAQGLSLGLRACVPRAVYGRHGAGRYHRQRAHGRSLWLGVRAPSAQALVQPHHHRGLGCGGAVHRRYRGSGADRGKVPAQRPGLAHGRQPQRGPCQFRLCGDWSVCAELGYVGGRSTAGKATTSLLPSLPVSASRIEP